MSIKIRAFGVVLIALLFVVVFNNIYNHRTIDGVVTSTFIEDGIEYVYFSTTDDNKWVCENNDYVVGGIYTVRFDCNQTDDIHDDKIVGVKFQNN